MPSTRLRQTATRGSLEASLSSQQQLANRNTSWARPVPKSSELKGRRQLWHVLEYRRAVACFWHRHAKEWAVRSGAIMEDIITNFEFTTKLDEETLASWHIEQAVLAEPCPKCGYHFP